MRARLGSKGLTRRDFLKGAGLGLAANSIAPALGSIAFVHNLRTAVLVPNSTRYPQLGENFTDGLKTYFSQAGQRLNASFHRASPGAMITSALKILTEQSIDVLVAYMNPLAALWLHPMLEERQITLLVVDPGSQFVVESDQNPFVRYHSLNLWQSNWAMASHAVTRFGQRAFLAASQYESGFSGLYAAQVGVEMAGGSVIDTTITHVQVEHDRLDQTISAIRSARPDFVFAAYSGAQAVEFVTAYHASGLSGEIPLVTSAYTVDDGLLSQMGSAALGIQSAFSWAGTQPHQKNLDFVTAYHAQTARSADSLALLGYETAQIIDHAARLAPDQRGVVLAQAISTAQLDSPRGAIRSSSDAGRTSVVLREVQQVNGCAQHVITGLFDPLPEQEVQARVATNNRTGWLNAYLS